MDTQHLIHITAEMACFSGILYFFNNNIKKLKNEIDQLKEENKKLSEEYGKHFNILYNSIDMLVKKNQELPRQYSEKKKTGIRKRKQIVKKLLPDDDILNVSDMLDDNTEPLSDANVVVNNRKSGKERDIIDEPLEIDIEDELKTELKELEDQEEKQEISDDNNEDNKNDDENKGLKNIKPIYNSNLTTNSLKKR